MVHQLKAEHLVDNLQSVRIYQEKPYPKEHMSLSFERDVCPPLAYQIAFRTLRQVCVFLKDLYI